MRQEAACSRWKLLRLDVRLCIRLSVWTRKVTSLCARENLAPWLAFAYSGGHISAGHGQPGCGVVEGVFGATPSVRVSPHSSRQPTLMGLF